MSNIQLTFKLNLLFITLAIVFLQSFTKCEISTWKWKNSKLYSMLLEGKLKLPYYTQPYTSTSRPSSIYFPPSGPGAGTGSSWPSFPNNYPSRNLTTSSSSGILPPKFSPSRPDHSNFDDAAVRNETTSSMFFMPPSNFSGTASNIPPPGPLQEPSNGPGSAHNPTNLGSGNTPTGKPSIVIVNYLPGSSNNSEAENEDSETSMKVDPGKLSIPPKFLPSASIPGPSLKPESPPALLPPKFEPPRNLTMGKETPTNLKQVSDSGIIAGTTETENVEVAGNATVTCTSTKAQNLKFDFSYIWKIEGFFDYAKASEKFKDPFAFKLTNLKLYPEELPGNWNMALTQVKTFPNHSAWTLNVTYDSEDDSKTYIEVHLEAKVGRKTFVYPAVTANHTAYDMLNEAASEDVTAGVTGTTSNHSYVVMWSDIKYDKHGDFIVTASTSKDALELNFNFDAVIVHKLVNSSRC